MAYQFPPDVDELVKERMASGKYASEDELLREALQALSEAEEDLDAVREALTELEAGDEGVALDEAVESIRKKHEVSQDA